MNERPIECANCQNKATIIYKEIAQGKTETVHMCGECPCLKRKLYQIESLPKESLSCPSCNTLLEKHKNLGCPECYRTFSAPLIETLSKEGDMPIPFDIPSVQGHQIPLHVGRSPPHGIQKGALSARLETLHLALSEALAFENYEQAANLRDQIKLLMEKHHGAA